MWKFAIVLSVAIAPATTSPAMAGEDSATEPARFQQACKTVMVPRKRCVERQPGTYCSKTIIVMEPSMACGYTR